MIEFFNTTDLAWAAGIIDGEGCIRAHKNNHKRENMISFGISLRVKMVDKNTIDRLYEIFGCGRLSKEKSNLGHYFWIWEVNGFDSFYVLLLIYTFMTTKKDQAKLAIDFSDLSIDECGKVINIKPIPLIIKEKRKEIFYELKKLKKKHRI